MNNIINSLPQSTLQLAITVGIMALVTLLTRLIPFVLFPSGSKTPAVITYLGTTLPYACMAMLVVYCFKNISFSGVNGWVPELIAGALVVLIHKWRHNMLFSILGGTVIYMVLVQLVFV